MIGRSVAVTLLGLALAPAPLAYAKPAKLPNTEMRDIVPAKGGPAFRIFIRKPAAPPPAAGYPVVYVTDANAVFGTMAEALAMRSRNPAASGVEPAVLVGIGYPIEEPLDIARRTFDLTPKVDAANLPPKPDGSAWSETGGADAFLSFIEDELKPLIEREFKIDKSRESLFGHSFGGLFALHVLFTRPDAFDLYVAASPSIWFGDRHVMKEADAFLAAAEAKPVNAGVLISVGEWEQALSPAEHSSPKAEQRAAWKARNRMVDNARELTAKLEGQEKRGVRITYREFAEEDHLSVIPVIAGRALGFVAAPGR